MEFKTIDHEIPSKIMQKQECIFFSLVVQLFVQHNNQKDSVMGVLWKLPMTSFDTLFKILSTTL